MSRWIWPEYDAATFVPGAWLPIEAEIIRLTTKINREQKWLDWAARRYSPPRACCPSCACPGYAARCDAQERREAWLEILEGKVERKIAES